jgi:hypothetical protein
MALMRQLSSKDLTVILSWGKYVRNRHFLLGFFLSLLGASSDVGNAGTALSEKIGN